jgi:hypothetical protein
MASALRSFSSARHSALARGGIAASTEHPAGAAIQAQNLPTICVCGLLLFCFTFACSEGHSLFDPVRSHLSAGTMSHSQYHIHMACLMEIKREK